eukprot:Selendium_serpulae@DN6430_c0_g1_i5.p1
MASEAVSSTRCQGDGIWASTSRPEHNRDNAGRQGRIFYKSLSGDNKEKVTSFCDVDKKEISRGFFVDQNDKRKIPIIHFSEAQKPLVICVKQDLTNGCLEENIASLHLKEGVDVYYFS